MMRPVLLNGYRNGGVVPRQIGKHFEKGARYHVFCPLVLIGLTKLPETALQRSIQVQLVKLTEGQTTKLYIGAEQAGAERQLRERCLLWALENAERVSRCYQDEKLRKELGALLGPGRISDDIWLRGEFLRSVVCEGGSGLLAIHQLSSGSFRKRIN